MCLMTEKENISINRVYVYAIEEYIDRALVSVFLPKAVFALSFMARVPALSLTSTPHTESK